LENNGLWIFDAVYLHHSARHPRTAIRTFGWSFIYQFQSAASWLDHHRVFIFLIDRSISYH
jgi:hypothetical protein